MTPKVLYLYWGGRLSWLRYLTVVSFKKHNPDWQIKVYHPVEPTVGNSWSTDEHIIGYQGEDYFSELSRVAEVIPLDIEYLGGSNNWSEVHKSDIFRLWVLVKYGGLYSDFDILYTKPMPDISKRKQVYCYHPDGHYAIGLIGCGAGDDNFNGLFELAKLANTNKYQSVGSTLWGRGLEGVKLDGWNIPKDLVYSYHYKDVDSLFLENKGLPKKAIGIHWYGGSITAGQWENRLTPATYKDYNSTITNIIKELS